VGVWQCAASVGVIKTVKVKINFAGSVYFAECGLRNAEFLSRIFCGNFDAELRKLYVVRILQSAFRKILFHESRYARQNVIVISRT